MSDIPTIVLDMTGGVIQWSVSTCEVHIIVIDTDEQIGPDGKAAWIGTDLPDVDPATVAIWEKALLDAAQAEDAVRKTRPMFRLTANVSGFAEVDAGDQEEARSLAYRPRALPWVHLLISGLAAAFGAFFVMHSVCSTPRRSREDQPRSTCRKEK